MPTTYAHWRFGDECIAMMPKKIQNIVNENRELYDIGVHGPDIFFYDLNHKNLSDYGYNLHEDPVKFFFEKAKKNYQGHEEKDQMLAYLLGFLSHFILDSVCHSYVEIKRETTMISHNKVESEWDRHLIEKDGRKTNLVDRSESLNPCRKNAKIISYFYPFEEKEMLRAIKRQKQFVSLLWCKSPKKYYFLKFLLKSFKLNDYAALMMEFREYGPCADSNVRLDKLKAKALELYPELYKDIPSYITDKKKKLNPYFDNHFCQQEGYKKIPVYPLNKELKYKVK